MAHLIGAFAEFEASLIRERVRAGLANAKKKGRKLGRRKERDDEAIRQLRSVGLSIRQIATKLGIAKGSVQKSLYPNPLQN
jgi:DNA invertase Pin-like site-specific DNA recombinase